MKKLIQFMIGIPMLMIAGAVNLPVMGQGVVPAPPERPELPGLPQNPDRPDVPGFQPAKRDPLMPGGKTKSVDRLVKVHVQADVERVVPGKDFNLAVVFELEPEWHIYWKNSGASGGPTEIQVSGPSGFSFGVTQFPRPSIMKGEEGLTYGYHDKVVLYVPVTVPGDSTVAQAMFSAQVSFMVCKDVCLVGRVNRTVTLPVGSKSLPAPGGPSSGPDPAIVEFKNRLPKPLTAVAGATQEFQASVLTIKLPAQGTSTAEFFPADSPGVTFGEPAVKIEGETLIMTVPVTVNPNNSQGRKMVAGGVIGLGDREKYPCFEFEIPLSAS